MPIGEWEQEVEGRGRRDREVLRTPDGEWMSGCGMYTPPLSIRDVLTSELTLATLLSRTGSLASFWYAKLASLGWGRQWM
jgi:hypothetical protein